MNGFELWAPGASKAEVVIGDVRHPMERAEFGYWRSDLAVEAGTEYRFSVDGGDPVPDPRSHHQPAGVHGPSAIVDHDDFAWTDERWRGAPLSSAVIYEAHIGTFTPEGTFEGAIARLDHLVDLGITHLELMPVAEFPGHRGWGYDGVDLYAPHHGYGGPEGLKRLVDACHARCLAVILDAVYNHLGPGGNYLGSFGPYFSDRYSTPWGDAVNFDGPGSDEVRDFFTGNAEHWLEHYHLDGLRIDAVHAILDLSAMHFLEELARRVDALEARLGRTLSVIVESDLNDPRVVTPYEAGGFGIDAQWSDDFHHALHALLTGETVGYYADFGRIEHLAHALQRAFVYDGTYSEFRDRRHGKRPEGLAGHRFLGYLQNHDQVGNRARGERSSHLMSDDLLKVGAALVLTSPFIPMLFQGEEWGATSPFLYFTDHEDTALGAAVSKGRRSGFKAFGWKPSEVPDPQDEDTFTRSLLDWSEPETERHRELLDWHRALIGLRRESPDLTDGRLDLVECAYDEDARWLVVERGAITICCTVGNSPAPAPEGEVVLTSKEPGSPASVTIYRT